MNGMLRAALVIGLAWLLPLPAQAGWVTEWQNTAIKPNGERLSPQPSSMHIDKGRVRITQPQIINLIQYDGGQMSVLNPERQFFWTGTVDEFVKQMTVRRSKQLRNRMGTQSRRKDDSEYRPPTVDVSTLPAITIKKTKETARIAGHPTTKYEIRANDELFQEVWIADDLDLSDDLDTEQFLSYQRKMSASMMGKSAGPYNALYRSKDYRRLLESGFALKTVTRHIAGGFEQTVTEIREEAVPASKFDVPTDYRRVRLADVFQHDQQGN